MSNISLREYWELLNNHDWFYQWSDDHRVYQKGFRESQELSTLSIHGKDFQDLYQAFNDWHIANVLRQDDVKKPKKPKK